MVLMGLGVIIMLRRKSVDFLRPLAGRLTSGFGPRTHPVLGEESFHNGADYAAPVGTSVLAPVAAVVDKVWTDELNGTAVRLNSGAYSFGFAHLSRALVKEGEQVEQGQVVALSGNTGRSTGPHLHVTVRRGSELVDPEALWGAGAGKVGVA